MLCVLKFWASEHLRKTPSLLKKRSILVSFYAIKIHTEKSEKFPGDSSKTTFALICIFTPFFFFPIILRAFFALMKKISNHCGQNVKKKVESIIPDPIFLQRLHHHHCKLHCIKILWKRFSSGWFGNIIVMIFFGSEQKHS